MVIEVTGEKVEVITNTQNDPGVSRMCADITLARQKLGYKPYFSLSEGIRLTIERDERFQPQPLTNPV
jgi:UDP-glucose 4-epimerase